MNSETSPYDTKDFETVLNYAHHALCNLDKEDREAGRPPQWHSLQVIVNEMRGYLITEDIWYLAEYMLHEERGLIERSSSEFRVKLTQSGRDHCGQRLKE